MVPARTWKLSRCAGWTCPPGTRPWGSTTMSNSSILPPLSSAVVWNTNRSPLTGLSSTCPLNAMGTPPAHRLPAALLCGAVRRVQATRRRPRRRRLADGNCLTTGGVPASCDVGAGEQERRYDRGADDPVMSWPAREGTTLGLAPFEWVLHGRSVNSLTIESLARRPDQRDQGYGPCRM